MDEIFQKVLRAQSLDQNLIVRLSQALIERGGEAELQAVVEDSLEKQSSILIDSLQTSPLPTGSLGSTNKSTDSLLEQPESEITDGMPPLDAETSELSSPANPNASPSIFDMASFESAAYPPSLDTTPSQPFAPILEDCSFENSFKSQGISLNSDVKQAPFASHAAYRSSLVQSTSNSTPASFTDSSRFQDRVLPSPVSRTIFSNERTLVTDMPNWTPVPTPAPIPVPTATSIPAAKNLNKRPTLELDIDGISRKISEHEKKNQKNVSVSERYQIGEEIARGGVGLIRACRDTELLRPLVMKTLKDGRSASPEALRKFVLEAQITAQLEHPNIVPVHDFGYFPNGEPFFTMKHINGQSLKKILKQLRQGDRHAEMRFSRLKLLNIFEQICMALGFAHSRGIIHHDIKPGNIMLGDFGETLLLDWGLAEFVDPADDPRSAYEARLAPQREEKVIAGTPVYMSPEQVRGEKLDYRSDIYALGAVLYEILCLRPPFQNSNPAELLSDIQLRHPKAPSVWAPERMIPSQLDRICLKCLEKSPQNRYENTDQLIADLDAYLSGVEDLDRRAKQSEEKLSEGLVLVDEFIKLHSEIDDLRIEIAESESSLMDYSPLEQKRAIWAKTVELEERQQQSTHHFTAATEVLQESLSFNPNNDSAAQALARLFEIRLSDSEAEGNDHQASYYRNLVEHYSRDTGKEALRNSGLISVNSTPAGARVYAARCIEVDHRLTSLLEEELGRTPLREISLEHGSWILRIEAEGLRDTLLPVLVERNSENIINCALYSEQEIGLRFLYVPGGSFKMAGDPTCPSARQRRLCTTNDIFMARYPVTTGEYLTFINDLFAQNPALAAAHIPRNPLGGTSLWFLTPQGYTLPSKQTSRYDWDLRWPVFGISCNDAIAFCEWYTKRLGVAIRLPTEVEWEKAARGTDGRFYPWGNNFDSSFCKMATSHPLIPMPECVGSYPTDISPYGIYDMAGLVSEYTFDADNPDNNYTVVKGGAYDKTSPFECRASYRVVVPRNVPSMNRGFRVVRDPAPKF